MRTGRSILIVIVALAGLVAIPARASAAAPDLTITVQGFPDPIGPGADLTYVIDVANTGNATATNVTVSDEIPAGTTFSHATNPGTWSLSSGPASPTQTFTTAVLPAGGS